MDNPAFVGGFETTSDRLSDVERFFELQRAPFDLAVERFFCDDSIAMKVLPSASSISWTVQAFRVR